MSAADLAARADAALASATPLGRGAGRRDGGAQNKIVWTPAADRALAAFSAAARGVDALAKALEVSPQACLLQMARLGLPRPSAARSQRGVRREWTAAEDAVLRGACAEAGKGFKRATVATLAAALGCREEAVTKRLRVLGLSLRGRVVASGRTRSRFVSKPQADVSPFAATIPCIRCRTPFDSPHRINVRGCPACHDIWAQRTGLDA